MREVTKCDTLGGIRGVAKRDTLGGIGMNERMTWEFLKASLFINFSVCAGVLLREIESESATEKEEKRDKDKNIV